MYCSACYASERPGKNNKFVVFGTSHDAFFVKRAHFSGVSGYTPHIIFYEEPHVLTLGSKILLETYCGIDGCGIAISKSKKNDHYDISFINVHQTHLELRDFIALKSLWKNCGYEIF